MEIVIGEMCKRCWRSTEYKLKKDGTHTSYCVQCLDRKNKFYENNKEELLARTRAYNHANIEKVHEQGRIYREANKEQIALRKKEYRETNPEKVAARNKLYEATHVEQIAVRKKAYREANKEYLACKNRERIATKIVCECGMETNVRNKLRHCLTKTHIKRMSEIENPEVQ